MKQRGCNVNAEAKSKRRLTGSGREKHAILRFETTVKYIVVTFVCSYKNRYNSCVSLSPVNLLAFDLLFVNGTIRLRPPVSLTSLNIENHSFSLLPPLQPVRINAA